MYPINIHASSHSWRFGKQYSDPSEEGLTKGERECITGSLGKHAEIGRRIVLCRVAKGTKGNCSLRQKPKLRLGHFGESEESIWLPVIQAFPGSDIICHTPFGSVI